MALFQNKTLAGKFYDPLGFFGKKKKRGGFDMIEPKPFGGERPYSGPDVGLDAPTLKRISDQYVQQTMERSRGEGLVGFDPRVSAIKKEEFLGDFNEYEDEVRRKAQAQSSGQGLRGGIPMDIAERYTRDLARQRKSGINAIDLADLEANREDRNTATYAQPGIVSQGAGIQQNRANFDLAEWEGSQPTYIEPQQSNVLPALIGAAGTAAGAYLGGPVGAAGGSALSEALIKQLLKQQSTPSNSGGANRSMGYNQRNYTNPFSNYMTY